MILWQRIGGVGRNGSVFWDITQVTADAWDTTKAALDSSFTYNSSQAQGLFFKPDGTKMYITEDGYNNIDEYNLGTAWDVTSASLSQQYYLGAGTASLGLFISPDGLKLYRVGLVNVYEYTFGTAWDVSTLTLTTDLNLSSKFDFTRGVHFKPDGTKMYVLGRDTATSRGQNVEYDLSTAWDISTAVFLQGFDVSTVVDAAWGCFFKPDGLIMYVVGENHDFIAKYTLGTAWDVSSSVFSGNSVSIAAEAPRAHAIFIKPNGLEAYVANYASPAYINSYILGAESIAASTPYSEGFTLSPDGTKAYLVNHVDAETDRYDLSTAYDVSTNTYVSSFFSSAEDATPSDCVFKTDGTKMYLAGSTNTTLYEYTLSTAWDITTAVYSTNSISVASQETLLKSIEFKTDGTKVYVTGSSGSVHEYNLGTAWNISTATFNQSYSVANKEVAPTGLTFRTDGTKMYICGSTTGNAYEYLLNTPWDISSASYIHGTLNLPTFTDLAIKSDNTQLIALGANSGLLTYNL